MLKIYENLSIYWNYEKIIRKNKVEITIQVLIRIELLAIQIAFIDYNLRVDLAILLVLLNRRCFKWVLKNDR